MRAAICLLLLLCTYAAADQQLDALLDFYKSTSGNKWKRNDYWGTNQDPCGQDNNSTWYGLKCSGGWVQGIHLSNNAVGGTIPPSISNIPYLETLDLSRNLLVGSIPYSIVDSQSLSWLSLMYNHLLGTIPPIGNNYTTMTNLYLGTNQLTGPIPNSFLNLQGLDELDLSENRLTGTVNPGLADLSLSSLWINNNALTGQMPLKVCQSVLLCVASFNAHLMCPSMSCTCGAMQSCNCNYALCQTNDDCAGGLCTTCKGASPYYNGYCQ